jgi:hypothetical protein
VSSARADAAPATPAAVTSATGFRWMWALLTIPIAVGTAIVSGFTAGLVMGFMGITPEWFAATGEATQAVIGAVVIVGSMVFAGLVVGWFSPGRTVMEPGVGIAAAVITMNVLHGDAQGVVMAWVVPFLLGAGGAWLGEWLQSRFAKR